MSDGQKDTIYIDVDDEITAIINKVQESKHHIVALVLPKRAAMLQSSVNMKLLKKAADTAHKQVVLITTEAGLLPLAGAVGLYAAKTLQSKPEVPEAADTTTPMDELLSVDEDEPAEDFDSQASGTKPVGELAGLPTDEKPKAKPELAPRHIPRASEDAAVDLDNSEPEDKSDKAAAKPTKPKDKKLRVPNFEKFRLRLILAAALLILLIVGFIIANIVLPHAMIDIQTSTSNVTPSLTLNLSTTAKTLDPSSLTVPAQLQQTQKSQNQTVNTTGQKNLGTKATGNVTLSEPCSSFSGPDETIPAGIGLSSGGLTFITQNSVTLDYFASHCNTKPSGSATGPTPVTAQQGGTQYNLNNATFTDGQNPDITGTGSISGGTDNIVQTVTQADIDSATQKLGTVDTSSIKTSLTNDLKAGGFYPIPATFNAGTPSASNSASVGDQANSVTVTQTTTYTMFGVQQADLQTLTDAAVNAQINTSKQYILDDGLSGATFSTLSQSGNSAQVSMQDTATVGPKLNIASLKTQVAGKKPGDVKSIIGGNPGVQSVTVHLSPFWVGSTPKSTSKITIKQTKSSTK